MASDASISVTLPAATLANLRRSMDRAGSEFGQSARQQVKLAAWSIGRTLGTSTRVAKPHIDLAKLNRTEARLLNIERRTGNQAFIGTKYFGGRPRQVTIYAKGIAAARKDARARNYRFGLAKLSWRASIGGLGSQAGLNVGKADGKTIQKAAQYAAKERRLTGDNPSITIGSFLDYATDALIGGQAAVGPAIDRAARKMMHIMDAKAEKELQRMAKS